MVSYSKTWVLPAFENHWLDIQKLGFFQLLRIMVRYSKTWVLPDFENHG
jgi:hypothetical protein